MARLSGLSERSVRRAVKALEDQSLIRRHKRTTDAGASTSDFYVLALAAHPPDTVTAPTGQPDPLGRTEKVTSTGQAVHQKVKKDQGKGSFEKIERERQRAEAAAEAYWQDQTPADDRESWLTRLKEPNRDKN